MALTAHSAARQRWTPMLRRAMNERRVLQSDLAASIGVDPSTVHDWMHARGFPMLALSQAVAEALSRPALHAVAIELRTKVCVDCGASFVDSGKQLKAKYCGRRCQDSASAVRSRKGRDALNYLNGRRLALYRRTVDAFCWDCEPEGICRNAECPIQVSRLSPLPHMDDERAAEIAASTVSPKRAAYLDRRYGRRLGAA